MASKHRTKRLELGPPPAIEHAGSSQRVVHVARILDHRHGETPRPGIGDDGGQVTDHALIAHRVVDCGIRVPGPGEGRNQVPEDQIGPNIDVRRSGGGVKHRVANLGHLALPTRVVRNAQHHAGELVLVAQLGPAGEHLKRAPARDARVHQDGLATGGLRQHGLKAF